MAALSIGDKAVAESALRYLFERYEEEPTPEEFPAWIIRKAETVQFRPSTRRLVLTFDLSGPAETGGQ